MSTPEQSPTPTTIQVGALNGANSGDIVQISPEGAGTVQGRLMSVTHTHKAATELTIRFDENNLGLRLVLHPDVAVEIVQSWRRQ